VLSRIAEALFWIGRYVERADGTSRILDVHLQVLLEDSWTDEDRSCRSLLSVMGAPPPKGPVDRNRLVDLLVADLDNPSSIIGALAAARENARAVRGSTRRRSRRAGRDRAGRRCSSVAI